MNIADRRSGTVDDRISVDVFISYSSKNKNVADAVVSDFEQNGIRCWYAPRDILPGKEWVTAIKEGIYSAKVFVLLFTEESNTSRQVMNEVAMAFNAEKTIVPFKLTKEEMSDELEYYLTRVHWLDAVSEPLSAHIEELRRFVGIILSGSDPQATRRRGMADRDADRGSDENNRDNRRDSNIDRGSNSGIRSDAGRRRRFLIFASVVAVLVIAAVILLVVKPFGSGKNAGTEGGNGGQEQEEEKGQEKKQEPKKDAFSEAKELGDACFDKGDYENALANYLKSLELGNTDTATYYRIAKIYLDGKSGDGTSEENGLKYLELAYKGGSGATLTGDEYYLLAYKYDSDLSGSDPAKVFEFAEKGAEAGSLPCMILVGEAYWYGRGTERDYELVLKWFGKALDSGAEGYTRNYCIAGITSLVEEGHVTREAAERWIGDSNR